MGKYTIRLELEAWDKIKKNIIEKMGELIFKNTQFKILLKN
jgi:hypothetical protein